jgi:ATP-dependent Clp protease ATP-binding subunit ClpC
MVKQASSTSRLSDRSKRVLALAATEASRLHYGFVQPEHVVLGLIADGRVPVLSALKLDEARRSVEAALGRGDTREQLDALAPSAETRTIIQLATAEADRLNVDQIEPKHVLLAITRETGRAHAALGALGLEADAIRRQIV